MLLQRIKLPNDSRSSVRPNRVRDVGEADGVELATFKATTTTFFTDLFEELPSLRRECGLDDLETVR